MRGYKIPSRQRCASTNKAATVLQASADGLLLQKLCMCVLNADCSTLASFKATCKNYHFGKRLPNRALTEEVRGMLKENSSARRRAAMAAGAATAAGSQSDSPELFAELERVRVREQLLFTNDDPTHQHLVTQVTAQIPCRCVARGGYIEDIPGTQDPSVLAEKITRDAVRGIHMLLIVVQDAPNLSDDRWNKHSKKDKTEAELKDDLQFKDDLKQFEAKVFDHEIQRVLEDGFEEKLVRDPDRC